jgi:predicted kinase
MNSAFQWMFSPDNDKVLILMRGVPASGKSHRALELAGDDPSVIHSADHFFGETPEEYVANWSIEKLGMAHKQCQKNIRMRMQRQLPLAIVDNTNTMVREIMPYFEMAVQYQYRVQIEEPTSPWWVNDIAPYLENKEKNRGQLEKMAKFLWEKNQLTHKVPLESIKKMLFRYHHNVTVEQLATMYARNAGIPKDEPHE